MAVTHPGSEPLFGLLASNSNHLRSRNFLASFAVHGLGIVIVLMLGRAVLPPKNGVAAHGALDLRPLTFTGPGGGGGGTRDPLPATAGVLPKLSLSEQLTPPEARIENAEPELPVEPTLFMAANSQLPEVGQLGDPLSRVTGPASNGPGTGGGIGSGCCRGVGDANGNGFGPGSGGIYVAGRGGVTAPRVIYDPEPAYSDAARAAKTQGKVLLVLVVDADGHTRDIHVRQGLGLGLDEKAIEAVKTWRFEPSKLDGRPVAVAISVEVSFRLY